MRSLHKQTGELPSALKNKPEFKPGLAWYYELFELLNTSRAIGFSGAGAIPFSEMKACFDLLEITDLDERECSIKMIRALDSAYLQHVNKKATKEE